MLKLTDIVPIFENEDGKEVLAFALELSVTDRPNDDNLNLIACVEQTSEGVVLKQILELKPSDNQFKELSRHYHPFTRSGSIDERYADYTKAFQEIQDILNSWDTASV